MALQPLDPKFANDQGQSGLLPINFMPDSNPNPFGGMAAGVPTLPTPLRPLVTNPRQQQENRLQTSIDRFESPTKPTGFWQNLRHTLAQVGNIAGNALIPGTMALSPGTQLHGQIQHDRNVAELAGLQRQDREEQTDASRQALEGQQAARLAEETSEAPQKAVDTHELTQKQINKEEWKPITGLIGPNGEPVEIESNSGQVRFANAPGAQLIKQPKPDTPEQQYIDEYQKTHPGAPVSEAIRKYTLDTQRPPQIAPVLMMVPNPQGGSTATVVHPGQTVAPGSVTAGGLSSESVSANKNAVAEEKAKQDAQKEYTLAQKLVASPSPTNDLALVMRYIGATKPDSLGKLRLNNNEIDLILGTRNTFGDLEAMSEKVRNGQMLTPTQRQDMLSTMKVLAGGGQEAGGTIYARDTEGKLHQAPAGTALPAGWKEEKR